MTLDNTSAHARADEPARRSIRRAVVAGGAGFIGSHLCEQLLAQGVNVVCVDNLLTGDLRNIAHLREHRGFELLRLDVTEPFDVSGPVDVVLNLASPASPVDYHRWPLQTLRCGSLGTTNTVELAERKHARYVLASTSEVYGDPAQHPQVESYWGNVNPIGPRSVYDEAKRYGEAVTAAYRRLGRVDTGIVRIFNTYGPRMRLDDGRAIPTFVAQALRGEPLTVAGDGSQTRSIAYVDDTVRGLLAMAAAEHAGPVNIGNQDETTMLALAERIIALTGSDSTVRHVELPQDDPRQRRPDTTLAAQLLGWRAEVSSEEGLRRTVQWVSGRLQDTGDESWSSVGTPLVAVSASPHDARAAEVT